MKKFLLLAVTCVLLSTTATVSAQGDPAAGKQKAAACAACHNPDGNSAVAQYPKLAGQHEGYLVKQLANFKAANDPNSKDIKRVNAIMNGMAMPLSEQDMQDIAAYYAGQEITRGQADPELVNLGRELYLGGNLATGVSACAGCHGPEGNGNPAANFPALAGQHADYLEAQLKGFRAYERANDPGQMMRNIAAKMTDQEIKAVASYIQGLQ